MIEQSPPLNNETLLLVLPIVGSRSNGRTFIDGQTINGLRLWLRNFPRVTVAMMVMEGVPQNGASAIEEIDGADRLRIIDLPVAYAPGRFVRVLPRTAWLLSKEILASQYLHFAIGGLWGDWGSVASLIAAARRRGFAVWTDRVESAVIGFHARTMSGVRGAYYRSYSKVVRLYERFIIRCSTVGLFHGMDCYAAYSPYCRQSFLVHDVHLEDRDQISVEELNARLARNRPLRIVYAGRAHREKGIYDWLNVLLAAKQRGLRFHAVWFGDGPDLNSAKTKSVELGLTDCVEFAGNVQDHKALIQELKQFDIFLFCHLTPESPRCLIEALICGLPIIGYDSPYPRDLTSANGGSLLTPTGEVSMVANSLLEFRSYREVLSRAARDDGSAFTATQVFAHRSELTRLACVVNG